METNQLAKPSITAVGFKYGLILGLISVVIALIQYVVGYSPMENQWITNIINISITVTAVVLAHKAFKDANNSFMSYGQGLAIAMITVVVSLVLAGLYTFVQFNFIDPSSFEAIWEKTASDMEEQGQNEEAIEMAVTWGRKLFWLFFILGGIFWGFIIGLIVTIFTQKREPETAF